MYVCAVHVFLRARVCLECNLPTIQYTSDANHFVVTEFDAVPDAMAMATKRCQPIALRVTHAESVLKHRGITPCDHTMRSRHVKKSCDHATW
jgi:hypothetical protein